MAKKLAWARDECLFCGGCIAICPVGDVITLYEDDLKIDHGKCTRCGQCVKACPMGALSLEAD